MSSTSPSGFSQAAHHTSPAIWAATVTIMAGSVVGGVGLIEWWWPMFWIGVAMIVVGSGWGWATGIMEAVSEFGAAAEPQADQRPTHRPDARRQS